MTDDKQQTAQGTLLWRPSPERAERSNMARYMRWLGEARGRRFDSYDDLWRWSVDDLDGFWGSVWEYLGVMAHRPYDRVLERSASKSRGEGNSVEGARWFAGAELNYAEHALRRRDGHTAVVFTNEAGASATLTYAELAERTAEAAAGLRRIGVGRGDAVVGYLPNVPEAVVAALAAASIGAVWSCCPPEFGAPSVIERFAQLEPKVLLGVDGYTYAGRRFDATAGLREVQASLPSLRATVVLPYLDPSPGTGGLAGAVTWSDMLVPGEPLIFEPVPFDHPLWVLYSSGTTGAPKAIVHGHGGVLVEHLKMLSLHMDLGEDDRFFWFTTTGWMMWNFLISGLLVGATIVLYDGSPAHPDLYALWRMAASTGVTCFGVSAPYILACMKAGIEPARGLDLGRIRTVGSTGSPLPPEGYAWVYEHVGADLLLASISGGTDVVTAFTAGSPTLPVHAGEMACRALGAKVESFDADGRSVVDEVGEMVVTEPMPSMPVRFLNDPDGRLLHESYFDFYPNAWRHGDWLRITPAGACVVYGRSDATLKRGGVRMGTAEFYRAIDDVPEVADSLVVDTAGLRTEGRLLLFVVLSEGVVLDEALRERIESAIRTRLSPRHVPDAVHAIAEVPRTLNGKKLEVPVKRILSGVPVEEAASLDSLANPDALRFFADMAAQDAT